MKTDGSLCLTCRQAHHRTRFHPCAMCAAAALSAVSCQLPGMPSKAGPITPIVRNHWVMVSSNPPTYYPRGVPADCQTDHWNGEWIYTGDARGTRYFIPLRAQGGIPRQILIAEALGGLSEQKLRQIAAEDREIRIRGARQTVLFGPLAVGAVTLAAMGGANAMELDIHRLEKEWYSSKHHEY